MKLSYKSTLLSTLILTSLTLPLFANASCVDLLKEEYHRRDEATLNRGDRICATAFMIIPMALLSPVLAIPLTAAVYGTDLKLSIDVNNAKEKLFIYEEAEDGSGERVEKLFRKLKRKFPKSEITFDQFIESIRHSNANEIGCVAGKVPSKKEIIMTALALETIKEDASESEEN
jgi:hypothetical protein